MRDVTLEDTFYTKFTSRQFSTGAPFTLAGTPVVSAYEDANLTQITAGVTLTADYDSVTGLNHLAIVATAANGFENGKTYSLVITTGTVDSVSAVGEIVGEFTIGSSAAAVDLANGTDGLGAIKGDTAEIGTAGAGLTGVASIVATHQLADAVSADGTIPTIQQALYEVVQQMQESVATSTTISVKKQDGSTELFTLTINNATNPTSITRAT